MLAGYGMQFDQSTRRDVIALVAGAVIAWPLAARAQQPGKLPLIGVLVSASPPHPFADAFGRGLRALGYSEGQNIRVDFRYSEGRSDRTAELAAELVRSDVAMIVAHFTPAVRAAMAATKTIPIVMAPAGAPLCPAPGAHSKQTLTGLFCCAAQHGIPTTMC